MLVWTTAQIVFYIAALFACCGFGWWIGDRGARRQQRDIFDRRLEQYDDHKRAAKALGAAYLNTALDEELAKRALLDIPVEKGEPDMFKDGPAPAASVMGDHEQRAEKLAKRMDREGC